MSKHVHVCVFDNINCIKFCAIVYNFLKKRNADANSKGIEKDPVTVVFFNDETQVGCQRQVANDPKLFVQTHLLNVRGSGGTHFGNALAAASNEIKASDKTCIIFLTDGEDSDSVSNGKKASQWAYDMTHTKNGESKKNVKMLFACFGTSNTSVLENIAAHADTTVKRLEDCHELDKFLVNVVAEQAAQFSLFNKE